MKFKSIAKILLSCVMAGTVFTGCGGSNEPEPKADDNKTVKIGMITHLNATEQKMDEIFAKIKESEKILLTKYTVKFYDNLSVMQMGLEAGEVSMISTYQNVADYVIANNGQVRSREQGRA